MQKAPTSDRCCNLGPMLYCTKNTQIGLHNYPTEKNCDHRVKQIESKYDICVIAKLLYHISVSKFPIFLKIPGIKRHLVSSLYNSYNDSESSTAKPYYTKKVQNHIKYKIKLPEKLKDENTVLVSNWFKIPIYLKSIYRIPFKMQKYDHKSNEIDNITRNIIMLTFFPRFYFEVTLLHGE